MAASAVKYLSRAYFMAPQNVARTRQMDEQFSYFLSIFVIPPLSDRMGITRLMIMLSCITRDK